MTAPDLSAPFPYFGGKSKAAAQVWAAFGEVDNYVEPFCGSAAMLLAAPAGRRVETINDFDGFIANFWRAISEASDEVARFADYPVNEVDLIARHLWLVGRKVELKASLEADPNFYDAKAAGWWVWGACNWIGSGWCSGNGPWMLLDGEVVDARKLPHLGNSGRGINRQLPHLGDSGRGEFIRQWFADLSGRLRDVRVACGDWRRIVSDSVTTRHGITGVFLDPPYDKGAMDYGSGGMGLGISAEVRKWCAKNGDNRSLRIVLCGHAGEHDDLLQDGWSIETWKAGGGYALTDEAIKNAQSETIWLSPNCIKKHSYDLFSMDQA